MSPIDSRDLCRREGFVVGHLRTARRRI